MNEPLSQPKTSAVRAARCLLCFAGLVFLVLGGAAYLAEGQFLISIVSLAVSGLLGFGFLYLGLFRPPSVVIEFTAEWFERFD
jgi:hypothetical protein